MSPSSKFLVYWTPADIDREAGDTIRKTIEQVSQAGVGKHFGIISKVATNFTWLLSAAYSKVITGMVSAVTSLVGRHIYYQHLLSARNGRNALKSRSNGLVLSVARLAWSCVVNHLRIIAAVFSL